MLELDLILSHFLDRHADDLSKEEEAQFNRLLSHSDDEILSWIMGQSRPEAAFEKIIDKMRQFFTQTSA